MKIKIKTMLLTILIITIIIILFYGCHKGNNKADYIVVNEDIIKIKDFSISPDSTELKTSAKGTIFIKGTEGIPNHIQIVAQIDIDPEDWGGVNFYIPKKWNISNVSSSYPEKKAQAIPANYVSSFYTASDNYKWQQFVEIGRKRNMIPTGGGIGTVIIDLVPEKAIKQSEKFDISIAVGCDYRNGIRILEPDFISIEIP